MVLEEFVEVLWGPLLSFTWFLWSLSIRVVVEVILSGK